MKNEKSKNRNESRIKEIFLENGAFAGINESITSFEPPFYFTKSVGRVMKLFIPKTLIDHIA